ncbi:DUF4245 family protein [Nocardioides panaciterrulae]|uniref:DUF4245 domain-containing protein n=1 Tax=Nocardioides panaciterrulae TaxID=661492 RepID=A0A7Y9JC05_9ACTN|nr:hypothetical protein [Nocardioides panaciterrulae]
MSEVPQQQPTGRPGGYQRSTNGLVGALVIIVVVILAFVGFRALTRDTPDVQPTRVDYLGAVQGAQATGYRVAYPASLPKGWIPDSVQVQPGRRGSFSVGMLTADGSFVGVHQEDADLTELLHTYVDENPTEGKPVTIDSAVGDRWRTFSDSGGDHAYATELGHQWVLVYGSADTADLRRVVSSLTTAKQ